MSNFGNRQLCVIHASPRLQPPTAPTHVMLCGGCHKSHEHVSMLCENCTSSTIQQKRTMLMALRADVAVLREKAGLILGGMDETISLTNEAEMQAQESIEQERHLVQLQKSLDADRITYAKLQHAASQRRDHLSKMKKRLEDEQMTTPVVEILEGGEEIDYISDGLNRTLMTVRRAKVIQLFQLMKILPVESGTHHYRTISKLPLPVAGAVGAKVALPSEVISAAFGRLIHLLLLMPKYLSSSLVYPHPMIFNGSFSTIGHHHGEGAGCHTLYPDGSLGFERGVEMMWQNIAYLCLSQGMSLADLHPTDLLGNLIRLSEWEKLGSCQPNHADILRLHRESLAGDTAMPLGDALDNSVRILPQYSQQHTHVHPSPFVPLNCDRNMFWGVPQSSQKWGYYLEYPASTHIGDATCLPVFLV